MNQEDAQLLERIQEQYQREYSDEIESVSGKKNTRVGKFGEIEEVRKKESSQKRIKYTISGPIAGMKKGMSNSGTHSIEKNRKYVLELASSYLEPKFAQWAQDKENKMEFKPVLIRIKGHSRGGDSFLGLGDSAETSVIYTALSNHKWFFVPQKVLGAKRIFITLDSHDVGLQHIDSNMSKRQGKWDDKSGEQPENADMPRFM